ncbi:MAG: Wzy polymerase domain-containing protein [Cellvibrionaceae bacterium]
MRALFLYNPRTLAGPAAVFAAAALLMALWQPNHYFPWTSFYNEFLAFIALLLLGLYSLLAGHCYRLSPLGLGLLALALVPWLQYTTDLIVFQGDALIASLYLLAAGAAVLLGRSFLRPRDMATTLAALLALAALVSVVLALVQWFMVGGGIWLNNLRPGDRPYGNLGQSNNLATLLCMGLAGLLYLWERGLVGRSVTALVGILLVIGLALTQSRTPWLISIGFLVWCVWQHRAGNLRLAPVYALLWFGLYVTFILLLPYLAEWLYLSAENPAQQMERIGRLAMWQQIWFAITQGGPWGYGWNQVAVAQFSATLEHPVALQTEHSHNIVLDILVWNGPLLGSLILLLAGGWLLRLYLRARSLESIFCLMAAGSVLIHGLLEFPLEYAYFLLPACVLFGLVESDQQAPTLGVASRWIAAPVVLAGAIVTTLVWTEYRYLEEDFRLMRFETARIGDNVELERPFQWEMFTQVSEYTRYARTQAREGMSQAELSWMHEVSSRFPYPPVLVRYGLALVLNGQTDQARRVFLQLRGLHGETHYRELTESLKAAEEIYPQLRALALPEPMAVAEQPRDYRQMQSRQWGVQN